MFLVSRRFLNVLEYTRMLYNITKAAKILLNTSEDFKSAECSRLFYEPNNRMTKTFHN